MHHNYVARNTDLLLPWLMRDLAAADEVGSRAGRTHELTHIGITLTQPCEREILLEDRKPSLAAQIAETVWVLAGRNDVEFLSHYLPRAKEFTDDGVEWRAGYGARLRQWKNHNPNYTGNSPIDQLAWVVEHLRRSPLSRQAVMSIWDPAIDTQPGKDIPCNDWLNFSSRLGNLDLHVALRSNDAVWGWSGINQFEWSVMLEVVAGLLGLTPGALHFSTTSFHIYERHWEMGNKIADNPGTRRPLKDSPRFDARALKTRDVAGLDNLLGNWLQIEEIIRKGEKDMWNLVDRFPEPMLKSWLRVLQWWWTGDRKYLERLVGTRLELATWTSIQPKAAPPEEADTFKPVVLRQGIPTELTINNEAIKRGMEGIQEAAQMMATVVSSPFVRRTEEQMAKPGVRMSSGKVVSSNPGSPFIQATIALHNEKHAAYGDSWKRRGEYMILANIARKIDRLGGGETSDETSADTAVDTLVYLVKYRAWLEGEDTDSPESANRRLLDAERSDNDSRTNKQIEAWLTANFDRLERLFQEGAERKHRVDQMIPNAYLLARRLWEAEQVAKDEYLGADRD